MPQKVTYHPFTFHHTRQPKYVFNRTVPIRSGVGEIGSIVHVNCLKQLLSAGYGISSAVSKGLGGDFETGRGLTAFVFVDNQAF